jgi:hypothetical protein
MAYLAGKRGQASDELKGAKTPVPTDKAEFLASCVIGNVDYCLSRIAEIQAMGYTHVRLGFGRSKPNLAAMENVARLILPRLDELPDRLPTPV